MATGTKTGVGRVKSSNQDRSSKGKVDSFAVSKRKIDGSNKQQSAQPKSGSTVIKTEREPLRIFYESLSKQIPTSEMAEFWMMEHGLLSPDRAEKENEKKQRKRKQLRMGNPTKSSKPHTNIPESPQKRQQASKNEDVKAKKRVTSDNDRHDFVLSPKRRKG